ncbi:MAG: OmpA family protein [Bacteroidota bacterium]
MNQIISQLEDYINQSYEMQSTSIKYHKSSKRMIKDMNQIVLDTLSPYQAYVMRDFEGFSDQIKTKIEFIADVSWNSNKTGNVLVDAGQVGLDYVRSKMSELKQKVREELLLYSNLHLKEFGQDIAKQIAKADTTIEEFDPNQPLIPIEEELPFMPEADIQLQKFEIDAVDNTVNLSNTIDPDLAQRMLDLMASNNQLIEKISQEMSLMRVSIEEMRREGEERDQAMYNDLNNKYLALRDAITQLQNEGNPDLNFSNTQPALNKGNVEIKFNYGSVYLTAQNKVLLNEVFSEMLRNNSYKLIITGFADRSGNKEQNILLSQKRAKAVKYHLRQMGISENRMVVNYLGDSGSASTNPDDRKVVIEWLEEVDVFQK